MSSITSELNANAAGRRRPVEAGSIDAELAGSKRRGGPPVEAGVPDDFEDVQLVPDEAELARFADEHPELAGQLDPSPKTNEAALRNAQLLRELKSGREAQSDLRAERAVAAADNAYNAVFGGDSDAAAIAIGTLAETVGLDSPEYRDAVAVWADTDPEAASRWLEAADHQLRQAHSLVGEAQLEQLRLSQLQRYEAAQTTAKNFFADNPTAEEYGPGMVELAGMAGIDLGNLEALPHNLGVLHEAARQADANLPGSEAWQQAESDRLLNAGTGLRRPRESMNTFRERMAEHGYSVDAKGWVSSPPDVNRVEAVMQEAAANIGAPKLGSPEWEKAERARLSQVWSDRPSVSEELHGKRRTMAAPDSAARTEREHDPDDPGGFWGMQRGYGNI